MRTSIVLGLLVLFTGCSSFRKSVETTPRPAVEKKVKRTTSPVKKPEKKEPKKTAKVSQAIWHLISPGTAEFTIFHQETKKKEHIRVETTLSDIELPPGHYYVDSIIVGEERYDSLDGDELFQFEIKKNAPTYIGSYVIECPKVGTLHFAELRKMKFFNRLRFTGATGPCEMIVGNDLVNVRRAWSKLEKRPQSKLLLGF